MTSNDARIAQPRLTPLDATAGFGDRGVSRRMRWITMLTAIVAIAPVGIVVIIFVSDTWFERVVLSLGFLATFPVLAQWKIDVYPRRAVIGLAAAVLVWLLFALYQPSPTGFFAVALVSAILLARLQRHRPIATVTASLGVALVGATALVTQPPTGEIVLLYIVLPFVGTLFITGVVILSEQSWLIVRRLERAKEAESELAVARERMRFAGDLHDIQGHTLHVIRLKVALAQRLAQSDPARANSELDEVRRLIGDTIEKTRELAYARHELNLVAELENARRLYEAAGMTVEVRQSVEPSAPTHSLLAHVLREATTNLLRHAQPTKVSITLTPTRVEVVNDGAPDVADSELRGLARLRERIELAGGELWIARSPGSFAVSAELPAAPEPTSPVAPVTPNAPTAEEAR